LAVIAEDNLFGPYTNDLIPVNANVNAWFVGIGLKYNLGSLWKNTHSVRHAQLNYKQTQEQIALAREGVENSIQAGYVNFLTSFKEVETQQKQVELATQNYDVVQNRYQNQLALLTDMLDASSMKLSADMALVNARISLLYNYYKLKYISNTL
jgi:outer membrane protein TolC